LKQGDKIFKFGFFDGFSSFFQTLTKNILGPIYSIGNYNFIHTPNTGGSSGWSSSGSGSHGISSSYGAPSVSTSYGAPSSSYGAPSSHGSSLGKLRLNVWIL
jgi:hypothetical protein